MENMGINQLANMYMGNPQPLAQKVQQAQQQAKPGQIPPDLEAAIALQRINEIRNAAGNQQAMQAGGPQPTVVDQLKQMLAPQQQGMQPGMAPQGMRPQTPQQAAPQTPQQAAPQMPQVRAARGGSIDHLASNLRHTYQGGGIIAFAEGGDEGLSERDLLRRMEAGYNPRTSEGLMGAVNESPVDASAAAQRILRENVMRRPEDERAAEEARARAAYGAPDTTGYDRAAAELAKRREKLEAPKTGMPALMEYLAQVAQAPRGMGSLSAGAMGAQKVNELQQQRESQQFDLTKQILEQEQKKMDTTRGYAKEIYGVGKDTYDRMFKINYDAAKEITNNDMEARKMAATATENQLNRENQLTMERERGKTTLAAAGMPGSEQKFLNEMEALRLRDPEAYKAKMATHAALKSGAAENRGQLTYEQAARLVDERMAKNKSAIFNMKDQATKAGLPEPTDDEIRTKLINAEITASGSKFAGQMPASTSAAASSMAPAPDAIAYLKQNPSLAPQFDAKYGAGASAKYLGR